jgi:hypothetical protein
MKPTLGSDFSINIVSVLAISAIARTLTIFMLKSDPRVVISNPSRTIWLLSDKIIQMRKIDVGICKIYSVWHQTIELVKNHRFYVVIAEILQDRSFSVIYSNLWQYSEKLLLRKFCSKIHFWAAGHQF